MSLITNLRKRGLKDIIRPRKWVIYLRYLYYKLRGTEYPELLIKEYKEQIVLRMTNPGCRECVKGKECIGCGCPTPEAFYDKLNSCSEGNWGPMFEPGIWREISIPVDDFYMQQLELKGKITEFKNIL